jgi:hypothetical protein
VNFVFLIVSILYTVHFRYCGNDNILTRSSEQNSYNLFSHAKDFHPTDDDDDDDDDHHHHQHHLSSTSSSVVVLILFYFVKHLSTGFVYIKFVGHNT